MTAIRPNNDDDMRALDQKIMLEIVWGHSNGSKLRCRRVDSHFHVEAAG